MERAESGGECMKVVINKCYGGFGLSDAAVERCLELGMVLTEYGPDGRYLNPDADFVRTKEKFCGQSYYTCHDHKNLLRSDPRVVQAVEELGEKADGFCAKLKVIEIPYDGPAGWEVDEYDGMERVVPLHESWS